MIYCEKCGSFQDGNTNYCTFCGAELNKVKEVRGTVGSENVSTKSSSFFTTIFSNVSDILSRPTHFFDLDNTNFNLKNSIIFVFILAIIVSPTVMLSDFMWGKFWGDNIGAIELFVLLLTPLLLPVGIVIGNSINGVVTYLLLRLFNVKSKASLQDTITAFNFAVAPIIVLLLPIPLLAQLSFGVWRFIVNINAISSLHIISKGKATFILILPSLIILALVILLIAVLVGIILFAGTSAVDTNNIQELLQLYR